MIRKLIVSLLGMPLVLACSSSNGTQGALRGNDGAATSGAGSGVVTGYGGSSNSLNLGSAGSFSSGGEDVMNGTCATQNFDLARKPAEILIVLDRSASMQDPPTGSTGTSKWDLVVPGVNQVVTATDSSVSWGLKVFPEGEGSECIASSVTAAVPVAVAAGDAKAITAAVTATTPKGNGTPTGDAIKAAVTYLKTLTDTNPKFILLATDGEPSCSGTSKDATAARTYAVQAVTDAATAGFKTFVVGVATTKATATQALNDMAVAGQMARADANPLATKFYLASTQNELVDSLEVITGQVSSCVFQLSAAPPVPDNIAVHVNGMKAPPDPTHQNGWDYTTEAHTEVQVYGSWCDQIKAATANTVNFVLGCPGVQVQ